MDVELLRPFLIGQGLADTDTPVQARLLAGGRSNLTYAIDVADRHYVLRRPPSGDHDPKAHDVGREYRILKCLHPTGLPVPKPVAQDAEGQCLGAPFYLMERVEGRVLQSESDAPDLQDAATLDQLIDSVVDGLVALHRIDPVAVGLGDLGRPQGYAARQAKRWTGLWNEHRYRDIPALDKASEYLAQAAACLDLDSEAPTIVHGDYSLNNLIIGDSPVRVAAILDWEMATLGHPLMDLGLLITYNSPLMGRIFDRDDAFASLPGFPAPDEIARRYAERSGRSITLVDFFHALALFKIVVLIEQIRSRQKAGTAIEGIRVLGENSAENAQYLVDLMESDRWREMLDSASKV